MKVCVIRYLDPFKRKFRFRKLRAFFMDYSSIICPRLVSHKGSTVVITRKLGSPSFRSHRTSEAAMSLRQKIKLLIYRRSQKQTVTSNFIYRWRGSNSLSGLSLGWLRGFGFSWKFASRIISIFLFCHSLAPGAHDDPAVSLRYACEDVSGYYALVRHMRGEMLKEYLNSIVSPHRSLTYKEVWDALKILDAADIDNPEASSEVVEIYSLRVVPKFLAGKPEGWNREHLWPRSYGLKSGASLTDLHNIRPADVNVNSSRGNKYYGECINTIHCMKPANREAAPDTETDKERWTPPLRVRGDIARALMYMAVCYGFHTPGGSSRLNLSDSPSIENSEMGLLSTLLKWHELDPPSSTEKLRNDRVCRLFQHNRNPFVDHPEYADLIWKKASPCCQGV